MLFILTIAAIASVALRSRARATSTTARRVDLTLWITATVVCLAMIGTVSAISTQTLGLLLLLAYAWHRRAYAASRPAAPPAHHSYVPSADEDDIVDMTETLVLADY